MADATGKTHMTDDDRELKCIAQGPETCEYGTHNSPGVNMRQIQETRAELAYNKAIAFETPINKPSAIPEANRHATADAKAFNPGTHPAVRDYMNRHPDEPMAWIPQKMWSGIIYDHYRNQGYQHLPKGDIPYDDLLPGAYIRRDSPYKGQHELIYAYPNEHGRVTKTTTEHYAVVATPPARGINRAILQPTPSDEQTTNDYHLDVLRHQLARAELHDHLDVRHEREITPSYGMAPSNPLRGRAPLPDRHLTKTIETFYQRHPGRTQTEQTHGIPPGTTTVGNLMNTTPILPADTANSYTDRIKTGLPEYQHTDIPLSSDTAAGFNAMQHETNELLAEQDLFEDDHEGWDVINNIFHESENTGPGQRKRLVTAIDNALPLFTRRGGANPGMTTHLQNMRNLLALPNHTPA